LFLLRLPAKKGEPMIKLHIRTLWLWFLVLCLLLQVPQLDSHSHIVEAYDSASGAPVLSVEQNIVAAPGSTIVIPVLLSDGSRFSTAAFKLVFDPSMLIFVRKKKGPDVLVSEGIGIDLLIPGEVELVLLGIPVPGSPLPPLLPPGKSILWNVTFRVTDNSAGKVGAINMTDLNFLDMNGRTAMLPMVSSGSIMVKQNILRGDINGDDIVDVQDLLKIIQVLQGVAAMTSIADVNLDGKVDVVDLIRLIQAIVGVDPL